jgi:crotonobetainyl-CoA:carnitine CoA-transferase CaiB-like acyl-CoA transferase
MGLLDGYVALDLTDLKGQLCGKLLRDLGFEVIKVEPPGGDPVRQLAPFKDDQPDPERSLRFAYLNAGKKSLMLDVHKRQGFELLVRLAERADVLLESGGLDLAGLTRRNPKLVVTGVTGFGQSGPHRDYLCPDIVGVAMGGLTSISGDPSLPPVSPPETQAYYFASVYAALGTLLALWQRDQDGQGRAIDVSAQEAIATQEHLVRYAGFDHMSPVRHGSQHEHVAPANIFPTQDGYVYLFVARNHWKPFLDEWPDHPPVLDDPHMLDHAYRHARADEVNAMVASFTRQFRRHELAQKLQKAGVPCLAVNTPTAFMQDEHIQARALLGTVHHPVLGEYVQASFPLLVDGKREMPQPPPLLGQHTQEILRDRLGLGPADIQHLIAEGVV